MPFMPFMPIMPMSEDRCCEIAPEDRFAYSAAPLRQPLRWPGGARIALTGISTNMCVATTAREAADRGYLVTLVEDACATTHADLQQVTMRNFQRLFGRVRSTAESLDELPAPAAS